MVNMPENSEDLGRGGTFCHWRNRTMDGRFSGLGRVFMRKRNNWETVLSPVIEKDTSPVRQPTDTASPLGEASFLECSRAHQENSDPSPGGGKETRSLSQGRKNSALSPRGGKKTRSLSQGERAGTNPRAG